MWVVNSYQLAVTVCLLPVASLGESLGLKRVYGFGLALFTVASLGCALSPTLAGAGGGAGGAGRRRRVHGGAGRGAGAAIYPARSCSARASR